VAAAEREERMLVAVVLDTAGPDVRFDEAVRLFDHAELFVSLPVLEPVELGCAGRSVTLEPEATAVVVPTSSSDLVDVPWPPRRCPTTDEVVVTPTVQRLPLAPVTVAVEDAAPGTTGSDADARLGRWVVDAVQRAMRAVPPSDVLAG
jgi:D-alanyl-D-alanine carboxypeptidase